MRPALLFIFFFAIVCPFYAQTDRWQLVDTGAILWKIGDGLQHQDHIEMSGRYLSAVVRYGVREDRTLYLRRDLVWPMLRTVPNNTHASLTRSFNLDLIELISIDKRPVQKEEVKNIALNGKLLIESTLDGKIQVSRTLFPSADRPAFCELYLLTNLSDKPVLLEIPEINIITRTRAADGVEGSYTLTARSFHSGALTLEPHMTASCYLAFEGSKDGPVLDEKGIESELAKRNKLLAEWSGNLVLETPDTVLNRMFAFAKIRAAESIYQTRGGPMHGPGGLSYYAAIWANDQAEYINPFFPYLGYDYGIESARNAYRHFARFMNDEYRPIPSSIIAEGDDIWNGAGDRGDAAMIAYGAARFALSQGDPQIAEELWPLITWCLEYNRRKLDKHGVVASDSDELEGRFPSGDANLCTSSLYYDALISAAYLGKALGKDRKITAAYEQQATDLRRNIEQHFGAKVMGFDTYRYYEGNDKLRAWICIPLTVNIFERRQGTIDALFSPELWTVDGLASQAGDKTFWDRSTLYALRGVFAAGDTERGLKYLQYYSRRRLLGEHVPYAVEAYPEGNQRHLSAESGLYCRIYTEGLFGLRPTGLNSFTLTPQLPDGWAVMKLKKVHGFQQVFDVTVQREGKGVRLTVQSDKAVWFDKVVLNGSTQQVVVKQ